MEELIFSAAFQVQRAYCEITAVEKRLKISVECSVRRKAVVQLDSILVYFAESSFAITA